MSKYRPRSGSAKKNKNEVTIGATDRAGLAALARYPFLTTKWLAPLFGLTYGSMKDRITDLKHAGYLKVADYQLDDAGHVKNYNEELAYELDIFGETILADSGVPIDRNEFSGQAAHRLMSCKVRASIELGTTGAFTLHTWHEFKGDAPHLFPFEFQGKTIRIRPDTYPFVIEHPTEPKPTRYFVLGVEVDCGTESIRSYDYTRSHINTKYAHYARFLQDRVYNDVLSFPECLILFTTTSKARLETMMRLWLDFTKDHPHLLHNLAFKVFKDEPSGWALSEPWQHADGELLHLNQP